jgi:single-strand DNA-binding protein
LFCEGGKVSRDLNKVMLIGNLGRDPEMRYTPAGRPVTTFTVATNRTWNTADGERHNDTEWFNIVAWGNLAEICKQHLSKGKQVYIEGRLQTRRWDDKEGNKHTTTEVVASEMMMLGERRGTNSEQGNDTSGDEIENRAEEDDFPF